MTADELIAALESAPTGTRELGVAVLEAIGCIQSDGGWWFHPDRPAHHAGVRVTEEVRVVCDLNFHLPGVPEGRWGIDISHDFAAACLILGQDKLHWYLGIARTEALARCVVQLKAVLAANSLRCQVTPSPLG